MKRREFITLVGSGAVAWPLAAHAQQPAMPVIGLLTLANLPDWAMNAIRTGLGESGFVEGRNLTIVVRSAEGQFDRLPTLVAGLVESRVKVILATGSPVPARTAKAATTKIPIVFAYGGDPVADGLVDSFNQPGGNVTGATFIGSALLAKRMEVLREIAPQATDVALLVNPKGTLAERQVRDGTAAAVTLGLRLHVLNMSTVSDIDAAFATMRQLKVGAFVVRPTPSSALLAATVWSCRRGTTRFQESTTGAKRFLPAVWSATAPSWPTHGDRQASMSAASCREKNLRTCLLCSPLNSRGSSISRRQGSWNSRSRQRCSGLPTRSSNRRRLPRRT
jgi:ABC transporter substrate binding protein